METLDKKYYYLLSIPCGNTIPMFSKTIHVNMGRNIGHPSQFLKFCDTCQTPNNVCNTDMHKITRYG